MALAKSDPKSEAIDDKDDTAIAYDEVIKDGEGTT
jgi:hypothetical protein